MKKYFVFIIGLLFLMACGPLSEEPWNENEEPAVQENLEDKPADLSKEEISQSEAQTNEKSSATTWFCHKAEEKISYAIDNNPELTDDKGRAVLCVIVQVFAGESKFLWQATYDKDFCNNKIVELINQKKSAGWSCSENK